MNKRVRFVTHGRSPRVIVVTQSREQESKVVQRDECRCFVESHAFPSQDMQNKDRQSKLYPSSDHHARRVRAVKKQQPLGGLEHLSARGASSNKPHLSPQEV